MPVKRATANAAAIVLAGVAINAFAAGRARAEERAPVAITPESVRWVSPPSLPGVQGAWLTGSEGGSGVYHFRVRLAAGARIPPHTHPDERTSTVLRGTLLVGFGGTVDEARMVAVPAGTVYVTPANVPHYLWARDGEVEYQEAGTGPTGTRFAPRVSGP